MLTQGSDNLNTNLSGMKMSSSSNHFILIGLEKVSDHQSEMWKCDQQALFWHIMAEFSLDLYFEGLIRCSVLILANPTVEWYLDGHILKLRAPDWAAIFDRWEWECVACASFSESPPSTLSVWLSAFFNCWLNKVCWGNLRGSEVCFSMVLQQSRSVHVECQWCVSCLHHGG